MASSLERNTNRTRPTKSAGARNRREKVHRRRLIALGVDEATVASMNAKEVRAMLKYPKKVVASLKG